MTRILEGKWVFDSQILIYILDSTSEYHTPIARLFERLKAKQFVGVVAQQNILEAENVLINYYHLEKQMVIKGVENLLDNFRFEIIAPFPITYIRYHTFARSSSKKIEVYDYFLAATMLDNEVTQLITANDKDFIGIDEISVYNPFKS